MFILLMTGEEEEKIDYIARTYKDMIYRLCLTYLKDPTDSEDALQQTFVRIMFYIEKIGDPDSKEAKSYIYCIAKSTALNFIKKRNQQSSLSYDETICRMEGHEALERLAKERAADLWMEVSQELSDLDKTIFVLKYGHKYQSKEIAEILDLSDGTVRQRLSRMIKRLVSKKDTARGREKEVK